MKEHVLTQKDGSRLHTFSDGEGPTVVLAHGYLDSHLTWEEIAPRLVAAGRRVILFDQRGHGASTIGSDGLTPRTMASDYAAVLEHYDVDDAVLVGHSMGAFLSVVFSILHASVAKKRLRGLVLVGGHAGDAARGSLQNRIHIAMLERGVADLAMKSVRASRLLLRPLFGEHADPDVLARMIERVRKTNIRGTLPILRAQVAESFYDRIGEIAVPAIVLCGELDRTCPRFHSERLGAEIPGSRTKWLPRIGHMVNYEVPSEIVSAIEEHLRAPLASALRTERSVA